MKTTVLCVFVRGHVPFTNQYVIRLQSMVNRTLPYADFLCLTDRPQDLPSAMRTHKIPNPGTLFGWWSKLELFNPNLPVEGRLVYFDLDTLLLNRLDEIVHFPAEFALAPNGADFKPKTKHSVVKKFNSSVMVWNAGEQNHLYTMWTKSVADRLWGDQDWIGEVSPGAAVMPLEWFPRLSQLSGPPWPDDARVILCKKPKNACALTKWPWFDMEWR